MEYLISSDFTNTNKKLFIIVLTIDNCINSFILLNLIETINFSGVFILLLLSGERNFGVRLNKPFTLTVPLDIPVFSGSHADLLIIVFHKVSRLCLFKIEK